MPWLSGLQLPILSYFYMFVNCFCKFSNAFFRWLILFFSWFVNSAKFFPFSNSKISSKPNPFFPLGFFAINIFFQIYFLPSYRRYTNERADTIDITPFNSPLGFSTYTSYFVMRCTYYTIYKISILTYIYLLHVFLLSVLFQLLIV